MTSSHATPRPPGHIPVLVDRVIETLAPASGETVLDCTVGLGGHAAAIAGRIGPTGTLVICDVDAGNLASAAALVRTLHLPPQLVPLHTNFADAPRRLIELGLKADVVLADLGFASSQVDDASRGLSFSRDGPLDMRLDPTGPVTAAQIVAASSRRELEEIIRDFGEERHAARIAQKLIEERARQPITTTARLAAIVRSVTGAHGAGGHGSIDPATRTFQALRIAVNDELGNLHMILDAVQRAARSTYAGGAAPTWLRPGARVGVISFHSLEDRPVKQAFSGLVDQGLATGLTRKPVVASEGEVAMNPRSRSAKLRAVRIGSDGAAA